MLGLRCCVCRARVRAAPQRAPRWTCWAPRRRAQRRSSARCAALQWASRAPRWACTCAPSTPACLCLSVPARPGCMGRVAVRGRGRQQQLLPPGLRSHQLAASLHHPWWEPPPRASPCSHHHLHQHQHQQPRLRQQRHRQHTSCLQQPARRRPPSRQPRLLLRALALQDVTPAPHHRWWCHAPAHWQRGASSQHPCQGLCEVPLQP